MPAVAATIALMKEKVNLASRWGGWDVGRDLAEFGDDARDLSRR